MPKPPSPSYVKACVTLKKLSRTTRESASRAPAKDVGRLRYLLTLLVPAALVPKDRLLRPHERDSAKPSGQTTVCLRHEAFEAATCPASKLVQVLLSRVSGVYGLDDPASTFARRGMNHAHVAAHNGHVLH